VGDGDGFEVEGLEVAGADEAAGAEVAGAVVFGALEDGGAGGEDEQPAKTREHTMIAKRMITDNLFINTLLPKYFARR
jgi:hypothetical protein